MAEIKSILFETQKLKGITLEPDQETALRIELLNSVYGMEHIRAAAKIVARTNTYKSLAWEHWKTAFNEPMLEAREVARVRQAAYQQGLLDGRAESHPEPISDKLHEQIDWMRKWEQESDKCEGFDKYNRLLINERDALEAKVRSLEIDNELLHERLGELMAMRQAS